MARYLIGQTVEGIVERVFPFGIFVRLGDATEAYIRRRELALDADTEPAQEVCEGDQVTGVVINLGDTDKHIELSRRATMSDHWEEFISRFHEGSVVTGSVQSVGPHGVFVRLFPGLNGFAPLKELATWRVSKPEELLWVDDCVEAVITRIVQSQKKVSLSIKARLEQREKALVIFEHLNRASADGSHGESMRRWKATTQPAASIFPAFPDIAAIERKDDAPLNRLRTVLAQVTETVQARVGLIFRMDPSSHTISILAHVGDDALKTDALYGLGDSPVDDVIRDGVPIFENRVSENALGKFSKLLDLLDFESCIGVPIQVHEELHHAAFFFHRDPEAFSKYRLRDVRAGALLFATLLAEEAINKRLRTLHPFLLGGELATGFGHEVANKVSGLELQLLQLPIYGDRDELQAALASVLNLTLDLKSTVEAFQQLPRTNDEQMSVELSDVNAILRRSELLLHPVARRGGVKITQTLASDLPSTVGSAITLQQVFLNLMLNAVQQMALKPVEHRVLAISTNLGHEPFPIQVRFWDTGPGIHKPLWEKIFAPGFSTRNGSGLGLFIARNFIRSLGGRIRVEESFVPLGTTFLVELPSAEPGGDR